VETVSASAADATVLGLCDNTAGGELGAGAASLVASAPVVPRGEDAVEGTGLFLASGGLGQHRAGHATVGTGDSHIALLGLGATTT
jgi:hypothetical protein